VARGADCQLPTNANTADGKKVCEERSPWHNTASIKKLGCTVTEVDKFRERKCEPEEEPNSTESPPSVPPPAPNKPDPEPTEDPFADWDGNWNAPEEELSEAEKETCRDNLPTSGDELTKLCGFHTSWDNPTDLKEKGCNKRMVAAWRKRKCTDARNEQQGEAPKIIISCGCPQAGEARSRRGDHLIDMMTEPHRERRGVCEDLNEKIASAEELHLNVQTYFKKKIAQEDKRLYGNLLETKGAPLLFSTKEADAERVAAQQNNQVASWEKYRADANERIQECENEVVRLKYEYDDENCKAVLKAEADAQETRIGLLGLPAGVHPGLVEFFVVDADRRCFNEQRPGFGETGKETELRRERRGEGKGERGGYLAGNSFKTGLALVLPSIIPLASPEAINGVALDLDEATGELLATVSFLHGSFSEEELEAGAQQATAAAASGRFTVPMARTGADGDFEIVRYDVNSVKSNASPSKASSGGGYIGVVTAVLVLVLVLAGIVWYRQRSQWNLTATKQPPVSPPQHQPPQQQQQQQQQVHVQELAVKKAMLMQRLEAQQQQQQLQELAVKKAMLMQRLEEVANAAALMVTGASAGDAAVEPALEGNSNQYVMASATATAA
jgi:hypothetical protein